MVARRTTPPTIDLAGLDDPLADALRKVARGDQAVQLTDGGRPLAQITPIRPADAPTPGSDVASTGAELSDEEREQNDDGRRLLAEAWERRRSFTEPYVFDQAEHDRITEERHWLIEQLRDAFPPGTDAVELIRDQRRGYWER